MKSSAVPAAPTWSVSPACRASVAAPSAVQRWPVPLVATSSIRTEGVAELQAAIDRRWEHLVASGELAARRAAIDERRLLEAGEDILRTAFARHRDGRVSALLEALDARALSPHRAARRLLGELHIGGEA